MMGNEVKATLVFADRLVVDFARLTEGLKRPLRNIAIKFDEVELDQDEYVLFDSDNLTLRITLGRLPILKSTLDFAKRPASAKTDISARLHDYVYSLEVRATDGLLDEATNETKLAVCQHVVQHLVHSMDVSLVHWLPTNTLFTSEEFSDPSELRPVGRISRSGHARPDERLKPVEKKAAIVNDTRASGMWSEVFPTLETQVAEEPKVSALAFLNKWADIFGVTPRSDVDVVEQVTVYVMTITLMVLAFPVGFALLIYNILRGESLRTTARVMALNGAVMGLLMSDFLPQLSGLV
ncbi:hypothetical protein [Actibacterium pelagium]|nr:hypothetical protein [Actibacterium pelagium]